LPADCVWITGQPGVGKTCFAFRIAKRLAQGKSVFYLPRGTENSPEAFVQLVQRELPEEWFRILNAYGITSLGSLSPAVLLAHSVRAVERSGQIVIVEAGEAFLEQGRDTVLAGLIAGLSRFGNRPRVVVTSYTCPNPLDATQAEVPLSGLTLEDTERLIRSYCDATDAECRRVHDRFDSHALSVSSWAAARAHSGMDSAEAELPSATALLYQRQWATLGESARGLFCALCDYPELAIPGLLPPQDLGALLQMGLLNRYPAVRSSGTAFYIHRLVREACYKLHPAQKRTDAGLTLLKTAILHGAEATHLRLIKAMFVANRDSEAIDLLFTKGRGLLEAVGFKNIRGALQTMRVRCQAGTKAAFWAKYLDGLSLLFDGQYETARRHFESLVSEAGTLHPRCAEAMRAEVLECDRRLGEITRVVSQFADLYQCWPAGDTGEEFSTYFAGVTGFLLGHSLKTFGQHRIAYSAYDRAEQCFEKFGTEADRVEALHCVYAKSVCMLPEAIERDDGDRYADLAAQTKSYFLRGLLYLAQARHLALRHEYPHSLRELLLAKSAFSSTTSVVYYQRACCAEAMLRSAAGDFTGAVAAISSLSPERAATPAIGAVISVARAASLGEPEKALTIIAERVPQLLQRGNLATVFSLLRFQELWSGPLPKQKGAFEVPVFESTAGGKWEVRLRAFSSLGELAQGLRELLGLPVTFGAYITIE
jgi:hypothetical protein